MLILLPNFAIILAAKENYFLQIWVLNFVNNTYDLHVDKQHCWYCLPFRISEEFEETPFHQGSSLWNNCIFFNFLLHWDRQKVFTSPYSFFASDQLSIRLGQAYGESSRTNILLASSGQLRNEDCIYNFSSWICLFTFWTLFYLFVYTIDFYSFVCYLHVFLHFNCMLDENYFFKKTKPVAW